MKARLQKLAQELMDDSGGHVAHDLDETLRLLMKHRETGYAGLGYDAKNDGAGARSVTIRFPSPSEAAKYDAMAEQKQNGMVAGQEPVAAEPVAEPAVASSNVVVRVAMDEKADVRKELEARYPKQFLRNIGITD